MFFASPLWLFALLPWAALAMWLLLRHRETTAVPFLALWIHSSTRPARRPQMGLPPASLLLLLLAIALSLLGAAQPQWHASTHHAAIAPPQAAITLLSAADEPHPQVLVQVTTRHFDRPTVQLTVTSGDQKVNQTIHVAANGSTNVDVDLNSLSEKLSASLSNSDTISIVRRGRPIDIATDARAPAPLRRLIELIEKHRGSSHEKPLTIGIGSSLASDRPGIVLVPPTSAMQTNWIVMDDPLTRDVDWSKLTGGCAVDPAWEALVFSGNRVLLARRKQPPLEILTSIATIDWPSRPSFVMFWTDAIDALAGGDGAFERYQSRLGEPGRAALISTPRDLSPGLYLLALAMLGLAGAFVPKRSIPYTAEHVEFTNSEAAHPHR